MSIRDIGTLERRLRQAVYLLSVIRGIKGRYGRFYAVSYKHLPLKLQN